MVMKSQLSIHKNSWCMMAMEPTMANMTGMVGPPLEVIVVRETTGDSPMLALDSGNFGKEHLFERKVDHS